MALQRISVLLPSGESRVLEVMPEMTGRQLKQKIKEGEPCDEITRNTTDVEIIVNGNQLLANDAKLLDAGIARDTVVSVVFRPNMMVVVCCNKMRSPVLAVSTNWTCWRSKSPATKLTFLKALSPVCHMVKVNDPKFSELHWGSGLFTLQRFGHIDHPELCDPHWGSCLCGLHLVGELEYSELSHPHWDWCLLWLQLFGELDHSKLCDRDPGCCLCALHVFGEVDHPKLSDGDRAFEGCSSLASLTIPDSVACIWHNAFRNCCSLEDLTIPHSVTYIGHSAFANCTSLVLRLSSRTAHAEDSLKDCKKVIVSESSCSIL